MASRPLLATQPFAPHDGHNGTRGKVSQVPAYPFRSNGRGVETPLRREPSNGNNHQTRIVIAGDRPIFRDGLRKLIESQPGLCVVGGSSVGPEVVKLARERKADILLLDLGLPGHSGLQVLSDVATLPSPVRILVLVATVEEGLILEAFHLGAHGVVLKGSPRQALLKSIRSVIAGQYWLDGESVPIVIEALRKFVPSQNGLAFRKNYGLTQRELEIVERIAKGSSNKEMGQEFCISERTVKHHLTNVFDKLGVSSRLHLAVFALEHRLLNTG